MPESFERGALTEAVFFILLSVYQPNHGYGIMQYIEQVTQGRVILGAGTLYGAINTLVDKGWIAPVNKELVKRKKEYQITDLGKEMVQHEINRLQELVTIGSQIVKGEVFNANNNS